MNASDQLEQSVIGAVILRPENLALLPSLASADFNGFKARATFDAIRNLEHKGSPIDVTTIGDELGRVGCLDAVGWDYLAECATNVPTIGNAIEYANRVKDAALRRRIVESLSEVLDAAKNGATGAELLSATLGACAQMDAEQPEQGSAIGEIVKRRLSQLDQIAQDRMAGRVTLTGYPTGVEKLDELLGGWQTGIVSIVAARPGMGKSSLGLATADAVSKAGFGVHLFSLEDTEAAYADRSISRTSQVPAEVLRNSTLNRGQLEDVTAGVRKLRQRTRWLVDGRSGITADEIVRSVRRRRKENETKVVIVDYVQLVRKPSRTSTHEALTEIVTALADAAKQDNIAYVVMSQLNRELEKRDDKRPTMSDLRESGSLEERAKCIVAVYRGSTYGKPKKGVDYMPDQKCPSDDEFERTVQLLVLKNSNGRTGHIKATWDGPTTTIA